MKKILAVLTFIWCSLLGGAANAADVSREPLHGFYVGGTAFGTIVNTLFQDWNKAASAKCGGDRFIHPTTIQPNSNPLYPNGYVVCWYQEGPEAGGYDWGGNIFWSDVCPNWLAPQFHDPTVFCTTVDEKPPCDCDKFGNPVIFSTRSKIQVEDDYVPAHRLQFSRFYNSNQSINQLDSMSPLWRHSYSRRLNARQWNTSASAFNSPLDYHYSAGGWYPRTAAATSTLDYADITRPDGYGYHFTSSDGGQSWSSDVDVNAKLVAIHSAGGGTISQWRLIDENSDISIYSADGYFIEMQFFHGGGYVLTYSDATTPATTAPRPGLLTKVTDNWNHTLSFQYDSQARMVLMVDAAMNEYRYSYDTDGNLVSITYPDMASRLYHYDEPEFSANSNVNHGLLTGISEEVSPGNIQRFSIYQYSARDAISSEHAGGAQKYVFDYIKSTVTEPLGLVRSVYWATVLGRRVITDRAQPNASGRGLDYVSTSYDAAGNISSIVGLDGTMTCFQYETPRNLETIRIEGVSSSETCYSVLNASTLTAPERRTTTVWHPTLRMPVSITGPLRVDERTYDEHGNMTTQTLTATSDTNGAKGSAAQKTGVARVFTFSYDSNANVLSAKGPRTDVNDTTVYTYDAAGALQSVTNPLGQVTTYSNYDGNGRPGRISQANGVVNDITYHPRGWVSSRTVTSQGLSVITRFDHDGAGQLLKVTLPDSSALTYTYDAAHRVTDLGDSTGNSVHYTLDGAGNRLKEEVRGSAGNLMRQTTRIYNAMSQLTQVTGGGQ